ncbi:hypothetical protein MKW98_005955 [Papaver atlanticum]|uniref:Uncharacterized protein n=1 Tax=Papaver atlanticum TaxID=357466 RepID=A0AAD4TE34_9MAGN|nr:hypothetical protein MKW98_005955 [Papaver atlanticum]
MFVVVGARYEDLVSHFWSNHILEQDTWVVQPISLAQLSCSSLSLALYLVMIILEHMLNQATTRELNPKNEHTETNAALEFAMNSLKVGKFIRRSCCGAIQALMSMQDGIHST